MNYIIGIDGGTTKIKAVLFDTTGHEIETVAAPSDMIEDGVRKELDMNFFWEKTAACVRLLMEKGPAKPEDILAVGVTGQGEGLWAMDKNNRPVGRAILWNDGRAHEENWAVNEKHRGSASWCTEIWARRWGLGAPFCCCGGPRITARMCTGRFRLFFSQRTGCGTV